MGLVGSGLMETLQVRPCKLDAAIHGGDVPSIHYQQGPCEISVVKRIVRGSFYVGRSKKFSAAFFLVVRACHLSSV